MRPGPDAPALEVLGRIPSGSNHVYLCADEAGAHWVYKPVLGERPLADFPDGTLAAREVAASVVDRALGWSLVPETVAAVGPGGPGMAQRWVDEADPEDPVTPPAPVDLHPVDEVPSGRVAVLRGEDESGREVVVAHAVDERVRRVALFDHVVNNADRKGGHLLRAVDGTVWAIDHGLCFHVAPKLRTVLWGWAGRSIPPGDLDALRTLAAALDGPGGDADGSVAAELAELLDPAEVDALRHRVDALVAGGEFPGPGGGYPLPWPLF